METKSAGLIQIPRARLGNTYLRVERQEDGDTYRIYIPRDRLKIANTDFILTVNFQTSYYCVFRHQDRKFEVVGQKVTFSGFPDLLGTVKRFNIVLETNITDPGKRLMAEKQIPIIWLDIHEHRLGGGDVPRRTEVDGAEFTTDFAGRKPVCYTDNKESQVRYGRTDAVKGNRLRVLKFVLSIEDEMTIF